jgi:hypothetical protein
LVNLIFFFNESVASEIYTNTAPCARSMFEEGGTVAALDDAFAHLLLHRCAVIEALPRT